MIRGWLAGVRQDAAYRLRRAEPLVDALKSSGKLLGASMPAANAATAYLASGGSLWAAAAGGGLTAAFGFGTGTWGLWKAHQGEAAHKRANELADRRGEAADPQTTVEARMKTEAATTLKDRSPEEMRDYLGGFQYMTGETVGPDVDRSSPWFAKGADTGADYIKLDGGKPGAHCRAAADEIQVLERAAAVPASEYMKSDALDNSRDSLGDTKKTPGAVPPGASGDATPGLGPPPPPDVASSADAPDAGDPPGLSGAGDDAALEPPVDPRLEADAEDPVAGLPPSDPRADAPSDGTGAGQGTLPPGGGAVGELPAAESAELPEATREPDAAAPPALPANGVDGALASPSGSEPAVGGDASVSEGNELAKADPGVVPEAAAAPLDPAAVEPSGSGTDAEGVDAPADPPAVEKPSALGGRAEAAPLGGGLEAGPGLPAADTSGSPLEPSTGATTVPAGELEAPDADNPEPSAGADGAAPAGHGPEAQKAGDAEPEAQAEPSESAPTPEPVPAWAQGPLQADPGAEGLGAA